jgi:hypothetical protein
MTSIKAGFKKKLPGLFTILSKSKQIARNVLIEFQNKTLARKIQRHYGHNPEVQEIITFLMSNRVEMIPYFYREEYEKREIEVKLDKEDDLYFVEVEGNNIYFPKEMTEKYIKDSVRVAMIEQDERSPHKYLPTKSIGIQGDVAVLCGASDGIYALQIINNFKKIYLFEANHLWMKPIQKTLRNYLDKIEVVPYFVSDEDGENSITLDSFFKNKNERVNYIQADIENAELMMLKGSDQLISNADNLTLALCCYHSATQERHITEFLEERHYKVQPSSGFLLMWMDFPLKPPYLRRGVLYATR